MEAAFMNALFGKSVKASGDNVIARDTSAHFSRFIGMQHPEARSLLLSEFVRTNATVR